MTSALVATVLAHSKTLWLVWYLSKDPQHRYKTIRFWGELLGPHMDLSGGTPECHGYHHVPNYKTIFWCTHFHKYFKFAVFLWVLPIVEKPPYISIYLLSWSTILAHCLITLTYSTNYSQIVHHLKKISSMAHLWYSGMIFKLRSLKHRAPRAVTSLELLQHLLLFLQQFCGTFCCSRLRW